MRAAHLSLALVFLIPQVALCSPLPNGIPQDGSSDLASDLKKLGYTTLVDLVVKAGLADTLASVEPATIFAPTNEAFAALPEEVLKKLDSDPELLKNTLLYHVIPNKAIPIKPYDLDKKLVTATGAPLRVNTYPFTFGTYKLFTAVVNGVTATYHDASAGQGSIVHRLDGVLPTLEAGDNIAAVLKKEKAFGFNTLLAALSAAELADVISTTDKLTVLAPTDEAFGKIPKEDLDNLLKPENKDKLIAVLKRHVIPQTLYCNGLAADELIYKTLEDGTVVQLERHDRTTFRIRNSLRQKATTVALDIPATNGAIQFIDTVLI